MEQVVRFLGAWLGFLFEGVRASMGAVIRLFEYPAGLIGVPAELFAAALLCLLLVALWRALGPLIT